MRLGLALSVQHPPEDPQATRFADHLAQVRAARAAGFAHVWASQHYLSAPFTYFQPLPTLARVAADAGDMTLGTSVLLLPLHAPVDVAEQVATLDVITGGRFVLGVGLGYRDVENAALGVDPRTRVGRLEEGLEVLERLWSGEPVSYHGKHFRMHNVRISLRPLQQPRPPIWLAANADAGVKRAACLGDAWLMNPAYDADDARAPARAVPRDARGARPSARTRDSAHPRVLRRVRRADGAGGGAAVSRSQVRRVPRLGTGQGAADGRELYARLSDARAGPLSHRRSRPRARRDRALSGAARRHRPDRARAVAGHGSGACPAHHPSAW